MLCLVFITKIMLIELYILLNYDIFNIVKYLLDIKSEECQGKYCHDPGIIILFHSYISVDTVIINIVFF